MLLISALFPMLAGAALALRGLKRRGALCAAASLATSLLLLPVLLRGAAPVELFRLSDRFVCALNPDGAGRVFLALIAVLWPIAALYASEYMQSERREGLFFTFYLAAYGVTILLASSANLFTLYIFYEMLTLVTVPLVIHEKDSPSIRATRVYLAYLFGGAALGFIALIVLSGIAPCDFRLGGAMGDAADRPLLYAAAIAAFFGFGVKAAVFPLCRWLPRASVAPTPVTALLHAVAVVNAGVFAVMRVLYYVIGASLLRESFVQSVLLIASSLTVVYGAVMAVRETHFKRRLAWSTVSNLGYMLLGLSLLTPSGMAASMLHMVNHGAIKIGLFFCAGAVMVRTGKAQVRELHGLAKSMPFTFAAFTFMGLALMGIPPLPGFVSKYALITAAFRPSGAWQIVGIAALLISALLTAVYIFTVVIPAYFMPQSALEKRDPGIPIRVALAAVCVLVLALSFCSQPLIEMLSAIAGV